jgi:hypothetical protein
MRRKTLLRLEALEARLLLDGQTDFPISTNQAGSQLNPSVAADGGGNFVVVWEGFNTGTNNSTGIFAQRFGPNGSALGQPFTVSTMPSHAQEFPKVAADANGDFVVVWAAPNPANGKADLWGERFDSNGNAVTGNLLLDPASEGLDSAARVAMNAAGDHIVVVRNTSVNGTTALAAQVYGPSLNALAPAFTVNVSGVSSPPTSRLAMDAAGNFIVTWNKTVVVNRAALFQVDGRRFDSSGNPLSGELDVSGTPTTVNQVNLAVAAAPDGSFLALWKDIAGTGNLDVSAARVGTDNTIGMPVVVSDPTTAADFAWAGFDAAGDSTIVWQTVPKGTTNADVVHGEQFDPNGNPFGPATTLSTLAVSSSTSAVVAVAPGGVSLAVWASTSAGIRGTFAAAAAQPPVLTSLTGTTNGNEGDTFSYHAAATDPGGSALTYSWDLNGDGVFGDATGPDVQTTFTVAATHNVSVKVTDTHNLSTLGSLSVTVVNVPPTANAGPAQTIHEGDTASFQGSVIDPGSATETYTYFWDFNYDGQNFTPQAGGPTAQHQYLHPGTYQVALQVLDGQGGAGLGVTTVTVLPDAPTASAGPDQSAPEGSSVTLHGTFTDPDFSLDTFQQGWVVTHNGTTVATAATPDFTFSPPDSGTYLATFTVTEADGSSGGSTATITVTDAALPAQAVAVAAVEGADTGMVPVATFTDTGITQPAGEYSAVIDWGDGTPTTAGTISVSGGTFTVSGDHTYAEEGSPTVTVTITDAGGANTTVTAAATVADAPLFASSGDLSVTEGASFSGVLAFFADTDPNGSASDYGATIAWGDGSTSAGQIDALGGGYFTVSGGHTYAEEGSFPFSITITDAGHATATAGGTAAVADAGLTATGGKLTAVEGASFSGVVASFTDADPNGSASDYSATVDWGDGTTSSGTIAAASGGFVVTADHVYAEVGTFTAHVTIQDAGGSSAGADSAVGVTDAALTASGTAVTATEGAPFSGVVASFSDANPNGAAGDFTAIITWGDRASSPGSISADGHGGFLVSGSHTYADEGSFPVSVSITDAGGAATTAGGTATVADAGLRATGGNIVATEAASFSGAVASFTDANPNGAVGDYTATITWGDHSTSAGSIAADGHGGFLVNGSHTYARQGTYAVAVTIADVGGSTATASGNAAVADAPLAATGSNLAAVEGASFSGVVASFTDANPNGAAGDYTATITWGDHSTSAGSIGADGRGGFTVSGSHTYADEGSYTVAVAIADVGGSTATAGGTAAVADAPLTATGSTISTTEGTVFSGVVASFTDANPNAPVGNFSASINWGDGGTSAGTVASDGHGGFTVSGSHTYLDAEPAPLTVTITDVGGSTATASGNAAVADASLHLTLKLIAPTAGQLFGGLVATLTDGNPYAPVGDYQATITWGDGSTAVATVTATGSGNFSVNSNHTYTKPGSYLLSVRVDDLHGGNSVTSSATISVSGTTGQPIQQGQTARLHYWRGPRGQALIRRFNGGPNATALANWLATTFPDLYGKAAGANNLTGKNNTQVAAFLLSLTKGPRPHLQAQILATALNIYATTSALGGMAGLQDGFQVTAAGLGVATFNLRQHGAPFDVANNTTQTVLQILQEADQHATGGVAWSGNPDLQGQAHEVFVAINRAGAIADDWAGQVDAYFAGGEH